ncbi:MAG TPA: LacI family DNA-binding transcriptional regulator [Cellulomonas sp.]|uniref:LacI family DNA-binding transcriptional regulator n=1 Tax=Cellulomonas sp. TaxID=40001 RepID=UPI002E306704|nr:LacI family DNA-binding transcriptional regulator [Cellulomonas sp.]HEX5333448.1 LacI family DNA-binding transcriptional regulator [Cellulomonas sp.]
MTTKIVPTKAHPVVAMDVARAAGVSQKTVSRVVNGDPHVSHEVRERVTRAIVTLGYRPNRAARNLVLGRSRTIGVLSVGSTDFGPSSLVLAAEGAIRSARYAMSVINTFEDQPETITDSLRALVDQGVDGIVVNEPVGAFTLAAGALGDLPVLSLSGSYGISTSEIVADADQASGARSATEHLVGLGHRTVHHIAGPANWRSSTLRLEGWRSSIRAAGVPEPAVVHGDWTARSGYELGTRLAVDPEVTAVFVANDQMAIGLMRAFAEAGRDVPGEVSVVGFDDVPEAAYLSRALTTVRQDLAYLATFGVGMLIDAIENPRRQDRRENVPVELVIRETTAAPPLRR